MAVSNDLGTSLFAANVAVVVTCLPELAALAPQLPRGRLLKGFEKLCEQDQRRFVDKQMDVFRH